MFRTLIITLFSLSLFACANTANKPMEEKPEGVLAAKNIAVVFLTDKGEANEHSDLRFLVAEMEYMGMRVLMPDVPWDDWQYDAHYDDALATIHGEVQKAISGGARNVFVAGHGMGANVAIGYAAAYRGIVDGVIALAPSHTPDYAKHAKMLGPSLRDAHRLISRGNGFEEQEFTDVVNDEEETIETNARIYLSWFNTSGPAVMPLNAIQLGKVPLLWIVGKDEPIHSKMGGKNYAFNRAPHNRDNQYVVLEAGHVDLLRQGSEQVVNWIEKVAQ